MTNAGGTDAPPKRHAVSRGRTVCRAVADVQANGPSRECAGGTRVFTAPAALRRFLVPMLVMMVYGCGSPSSLTGQKLAVQIADRTFDLEIAADDAARYQGLSDRAHIPADGGMLFVYPRETTLTFVMRRCLVPIDLLFLDASGRVVRMHAMAVEPYDTRDEDLARYSSAPYPAQFAIEVAGGTIRELGVTAGDKITLPLDDLKRLAK